LTNIRLKNLSFCTRISPDNVQYIWPKHVADNKDEGIEFMPEGKKPIGRPRMRWEDNIKMDLQEVGCGGVDWIDLAQDRDKWWAFVTAVMNLRVQ
jgi:hypothetical protein